VSDYGESWRDSEETMARERKDVLIGILETMKERLASDYFEQRKLAWRECRRAGLFVAVIGLTMGFFAAEIGSYVAGFASSFAFVSGTVGAASSHFKLRAVIRHEARWLDTGKF
jgi:hypothetical protein